MEFGMVINMCEPMKIVNCRECGSHAEIAIDIDTENKSDMFLIRCTKCDKHTLKCKHIEDAIVQWSELNKPLKAKPRYACGYCGTEIHLGFAVCPYCNVQIDWN